MLNRSLESKQTCKWCGKWQVVSNPKGVYCEYYSFRCCAVDLKGGCIHWWIRSWKVFACICTATKCDKGAISVTKRLTVSTASNLGGVAWNLLATPTFCCLKINTRWVEVRIGIAVELTMGHHVEHMSCEFTLSCLSFAQAYFNIRMKRCLWLPTSDFCLV